MKKLLKKLWFFLQRKRICAEPGCLEQGFACRLYDYFEDREAFEYFCAEHARKNGYCWYCGEFWAGCEAFDFNPSGLCPNCKDEVDNDLGEYDEPDTLEDFIYDLEHEK